MNEQEILEYRKRSAERLGFYPDNRDNIYFKTVGKNISVPIVWMPDQDANQMLMIENWLTEHRCRLQIEYCPNYEAWIVIIDCGEKGGVNANKSKFIAFAKAFLEYDKAQ